MKMVRVLIYSPNAVEKGRGGEISSMELANGLSNYYKITFVHTNKLDSEKLLSNTTIRKILGQVKIESRIKFATMSFSDKLFTFPYPREVVKMYNLVKNQDIIYTSLATIKETIMFIFFSLLHRRGKFIIGYRRPLHIEKRFSLYNLKSRTSTLLLSLCKKRFYIHTISAHTKKYLEHYFNKDKITHIIHGVNLENYVNNMEKNNENILSFIYIGYLDDPHKGVDVLISAIDEFLVENKNKNFLFEFCGVGPLESEVKKLENKHPKQIKYHGYISNDKIPEYYKRSSVFLFTSRKEPFGRVIIEALASKVLILCTKTLGSLEILAGKEFAFFINELSSEAIKKEINEIYNLWLTKPQRFKELQKSAKDYAFKSYSFPIELEMFNLFIKRILKT